MGRADAAGAPAPVVRVAIAFSPIAGRAFELALDLPAPATALDAVRASGVFERHPELALGEPLLGIWGRACAPETVLADGDRVEIYRPLTMDPNEARRLRAKNLRAAARR
jgi:putative ubiquitin-RnfH superfamily antitoxin RatB of RatAB toxin-antitoxin module